MDFYSPTPHMIYAFGNASFTADVNGIIHNVPGTYAQSLITAGCVPLPPTGWADPRPTPTAASVDFVGVANVSYVVGTTTFTADAHGIVYHVPAVFCAAMLNFGCTPLSPFGFADPRTAQ